MGVKMAYCVKCGVKIIDSDCCPLCKTKIPVYEDLKKTYNDKVDVMPKEINYLYYSKLVCSLLIISSLICLLCNWLINHKLSWSLYVIFSSIYIMSHYFMINTKYKMRGFILSSLSLELLIGVIAYLTNGLKWFCCLVGPFLIIGIFFIFLYINLLLKEKKNILRDDSYLLLYILLSLILIDGFIKLFNIGIFKLGWSIIAGIPIGVIAIMMFILSYNKKIVAEIEKRFFV